MPFVREGKKRKSGKIPSNRDLRAGTFFPLLSQNFLRTPCWTIDEITGNLLDRIRNFSSVPGHRANIVCADRDGDVWRAAWPRGESVYVDGNIPCALRFCDFVVVCVRCTRNPGWAGTYWKREIGPGTVGGREFSVTFGNAAGNCARCVFTDSASARTTC